MSMCRRACGAAVRTLVLMALCLCFMPELSPSSYSCARADEPTNLVANASRGTSYPTVQAAFDAASAGDKLKLLADATSNDTLTLAASCELDLAGHVLTIDAGKQANATAQGTGAALVYSGSGTFEVSDSAGTGRFDIHLGSDAETVALGRYPYRGIMVSGGGSLVIDAADVKVNYLGRSSTNREVSVEGVSLLDGSVELSGASVLEVFGDDGQNVFGAVHVRGISAAAAAKGTKNSVVVGKQARLSVRSGYAGYKTGKNTYAEQPTILTNKNLIEIFPDRDSAFYKEVAQVFLDKAGFDNPNSEQTGSGYRAERVHGAGIYYMAGVQVSDGALVWAFSDYVQPKEVGKLASIVPEHIFVQSYVDVRPEVCGVFAGSNGIGSVHIAGSLDIRSDAGDANAFESDGPGTWTIDESAEVGVYAEGGVYRQKYMAYDLREVIDFPMALDSAVRYPRDDTGQFVRLANPCAQLKAGSFEGASFSCAANVQERDNGACDEVLHAPDYVFGSSVSIVFDGLKDAKGADVSSEELTVSYGHTLSDEQKQSPHLQDYEKDGVRYCFVGWRFVSLSVGDRIWDAACFDATFAADYTKSMSESGGAIHVTAEYIAVPEGSFLVQFKAADYVFSYAAPANSRPDYKQTGENITGEYPNNPASQQNNSHLFRGWVAGKRDVAYSAGPESPIVADSAAKLPLVTSDVCYEASYVRTSFTSKLYFEQWKKSVDGGYVLMRDVCDYPTGSDLSDELASRPQPGDRIAAKGQIHTFRGWGVRPSDVEPVYISELPVFNSSRTYYGVYDSEEYLISAVFFVKGQVYSEGIPMNSETTLDEAWRASSSPIDPGLRSDGAKFRGWATTEDADKALRGAIVTLEDITSDLKDTVELYAVYSLEEETDGGSADDGDNSNPTPAASETDKPISNEKPTSGESSMAGKKTGTSKGKSAAKNAAKTVESKTPSVSTGGSRTSELVPKAEPAEGASAVAKTKSATKDDSSGDTSGTEESAQLSEDPGAEETDTPSFDAGFSVDGNDAAVLALILLLAAGFVLWLIARIRRERKEDTDPDLYFDPTAAAGNASAERIEF